MKKRFLSIVLAVCMLAGTEEIMPGDLTVQAEEVQSGSETTDQTVFTLSSVETQTESFIYSGKANHPAIVVTDTDGQIVDASNYTVTYADNTDVGQATVTVSGDGNYIGTVSASFTILPKGTALSAVTAKKKGFLARWKKQEVQTTGYQLQYGTNAQLKGAKTLTVKKNKTVSAAVKKLKAKKKYYVRIRTYKTVRIDGKSSVLYSDWSKTKTVKVK